MAARLEVVGLRICIAAVLLALLIPSGKCVVPDSGHGATAGNPPPANDHFVNLTRLEGDSVEIRGALSGATIETEELLIGEIPEWFPGTSSVWFSWKAPASGLGLVVPKTKDFAFITITTGTNLIAAQEAGNLVAEVEFASDYAPNRYVTFDAEKDVEYQIRILGLDRTNEFLVSLSLTNLPVILRHPRSRTASPGACAFFTVSCVAHQGELPSIQWQLNGADLAGKTGPMLALTNVSLENAGDYRAVITSPRPEENGQFLSRTSNVAQLFVKEPAQPTLEIWRQDDGIYVDIRGELGRSYVLRSMRGLGDRFEAFVSSSVFPTRFGDLWVSSEIGGAVYVEVRVPSSPVCDLNLTRIHFAKIRLTEDRNLSPGAAYSDSDLEPYLSEDLQCPAGGTYSYGMPFVDPICTKGSFPDLHTLEVGSPW